MVNYIHRNSAEKRRHLFKMASTACCVMAGSGLIASTLFITPKMSPLEQTQVVLKDRCGLDVVYTDIPTDKNVITVSAIKIQLVASQDFNAWKQAAVKTTHANGRSVYRAEGYLFRPCGAAYNFTTTVTPRAGVKPQAG